MTPDRRRCRIGFWDIDQAEHHAELPRLEHAVHRFETQLAGDADLQGHADHALRFGQGCAGGERAGAIPAGDLALLLTALPDGDAAMVIGPRRSRPYCSPISGRPSAE